MSCCEYTDWELIEIVQEYGERHGSFDTSFADSLEDALSEYDELTCGQRGALENIVLKFRMLDEDNDG